MELKDLHWQRRIGLLAAAIAAHLLILYFLCYKPFIEPLGLAAAVVVVVFARIALER